MKKEKHMLKSMTDFVLEQDKEPILGLINYEYQKIRKYANFLGGINLKTVLWISK